MTRAFSGAVDGLSGEFAHISAVELAQEDPDDTSAEEMRPFPRRPRRSLPRWAVVLAVMGTCLVACALVAGVAARRSRDNQAQRLTTQGETPGGLPLTDLYMTTDGIERTEPCLTNEELYQNLCYKKCSILSQDMYPYRTASNSCCKEEGPCYDTTKYKTVGLGCNGWGIGGGAAGGPRACSHVPMLQCGTNEEMYPQSSGLCYRKCAILTNNTRPLREGPATCAGTSFGSEFTHGAPCDRDGFNINGNGGCPSLPWA